MTVSQFTCSDIDNTSVSCTHVSMYYVVCTMYLHTCNYENSIMLGMQTIKYVIRIIYVINGIFTTIIFKTRNIIFFYNIQFHTYFFSFYQQLNWWNKKNLSGKDALLGVLYFFGSYSDLNGSYSSIWRQTANIYNGIIKK